MVRCLLTSPPAGKKLLWTAATLDLGRSLFLHLGAEGHAGKRLLTAV